MADKGGCDEHLKAFEGSVCKEGGGDGLAGLSGITEEALSQGVLGSKRARFLSLIGGQTGS